MTYDAQRVLVGREPVTVVDIVADYCDNTFSVAPCTATGASGSECYNAYFHCQDQANYVLTTKTYRFIDQHITPPPGELMIPSLISAGAAPAKIEPGKGLGRRASVTITLQDHPHNDRDTDPYVDTRSYTPGTQGTYWGKWLARNRYYQGRLIKVRRGYVTAPWDWNNFEDHTYVIETIEGPDHNGKVRIVAKDMLKLADDKRAKVPAASSGKLRIDMDAEGATIYVTEGTGADYGSSGYVRIGSEIIKFDSRTTDDLESCTRAQWGTSAGSHTIDDTVQLCKAYDGDNAVDVAYDLLNTYSGVDVATYVTSADWDSERDTWMPSGTVQGILSEPTGVNKLLGELSEQYGFVIWWDDVAQKIKLKALAPYRGTRPGVTAAELVADSLSVKQLPKERLSQIWFHFDMINHAEKGGEKSNYQTTLVHADLTKEGANLYGEARVKEIKSRWVAVGGVALFSAGRTLSRAKENPKEFKWRMDAGATLPDIGDEYTIVMRTAQDQTGASATEYIQITAKEEVVPGSVWEFTAITSAFAADRFAYITATGMGNYTAETAANQLIYGFIADGTTGLMSNGDAPYLII